MSGIEEAVNNLMAELSQLKKDAGADTKAREDLSKALQSKALDIKNLFAQEGTLKGASLAAEARAFVFLWESHIGLRDIGETSAPVVKDKPVPKKKKPLKRMSNGYSLREKENAHLKDYMGAVEPGEWVSIPYENFDPVVLSRQAYFLSISMWGQRTASVVRDDNAKKLEVMRRCKDV